MLLYPFLILFASAPLALAAETLPMKYIHVALANANANALNMPEPVNATTIPRPVLNTGPPPQFEGATGTAIFRGQSAAIRFTSPSDVFGGSRLIGVELIIHGGKVPSQARLSIAEDSGYNSPGSLVLETRVISIPAYNGRITIKADSPGTLILYPGEIFWVTLDGDTKYVTDAISWLDSERGLGWTAFKTSNFAKRKVQVDGSRRDEQIDEPIDFQAITVSGSGWVVEKSRTASATAVIVS
ncbi:hypothetical protein HDU97_007293 [Phlyctochytrium planicorne]|nr:hypothetical protein HDU97_007293 [Phlyctochytrium planicorne]